MCAYLYANHQLYAMPSSMYSYRFHIICDSASKSSTISSEHISQKMQIQQIRCDTNAQRNEIEKKKPEHNSHSRREYTNDAMYDCGETNARFVAIGIVVGAAESKRTRANSPFFSNGLGARA